MIDDFKLAINKAKKDIAGKKIDHKEKIELYRSLAQELKAESTTISEKAKALMVEGKTKHTKEFLNDLTILCRKHNVFIDSYDNNIDLVYIKETHYEDEDDEDYEEAETLASNIYWDQKSKSYIKGE